MSSNKDLTKAMTVGELIEMLQDFDADTPILFAYNYGDHGQTQVSQTINTVSIRKVDYASYFRAFKVYDEDDTAGVTAIVIE